ncbi:MAG: energy-coupling factor ABC transporter permease [Caldimicrobium sp.]|nr:energy-coupling factor ABC transporter permease [Caldimicrobium sp.]MCX7874011.1 energy-coupling factor ABC transporter permease [Caldimicrobium sp.]MDW8094159.1 energy-coupling factor ABC transporter permease [Caldimicrobium sp.]
MKERALLLGSLIVLSPELVYGMHISEGILPLKWALFWWLITAVILGLALRGVRNFLMDDLQRKALFTFVTAFIFLISLIPIPVPIAGTSSHPVGVATGVFVLGVCGSIVAGFIVLLLQAFLLAHGGLSTLGANTLAMAVIGSLSAYLVILLLQRTPFPLYVKAFISGAVANWATYLVTALQLSLALKGDEPLEVFLIKTILAFMPTQLPMGIIEGVITASVVTAIAKKRGDLMVSKYLNLREGVVK